MFKKLCVLAATTAVLSSPALADNNFGPDLVDVGFPVAYTVGYGGEAWNDYFTFEIASGSSVTVDFQLYPDFGTDMLQPEFFLRDTTDINNPFNVAMWNLIGYPNYGSTGTATWTIGGLSTAAQYTLNVYGGGSVGSNTGEYDLTLSLPVPEPETYAMLLAGLGLVGMAARRRRQRLDS